MSLNKEKQPAHWMNMNSGLSVILVGSDLSFVYERIRDYALAYSQNDDDMCNYVANEMLEYLEKSPRSGFAGKMWHEAIYPHDRHMNILPMATFGLYFTLLSPYAKAREKNNTGKNWDGIATMPNNWKVSTVSDKYNEFIESEGNLPSQVGRFFGSVGMRNLMSEHLTNSQLAFKIKAQWTEKKFYEI